MGCVRQAVLEFDEEVQAPWRPLLVPGAGATDPAPAARYETAGPRPSREGSCRPPASPDRRAVGAPTAPARPRPGPEAPHRPGGSRVAAAGGGPRGPVRRTTVTFTRRAHRLAVALALCGGLVAGSWLGQLYPDAGAQGLRLVGVSSVVVEPGDTLWSIATSVAEGDDVRTVVDRIQELNGLEDAELVPGQVLVLP